jgi:GTP-dependent phosphoenolpyruvate carboxykinase
MLELRSVHPDDLREQIPQMKQHFAQFGDRLPDQIRRQMDALEEQLG